jgi:hypothetical protein
MPISHTRTLRAFISYSNDNKLIAAKTKAALSSLGIECFMAHDDIDVSDQWKERIIKELGRTHIVVPILSTSFKKSEWAPQEVGYIAIARPKVLVIPLQLDATISFGFFSHIQSRPRPLDSQLINYFANLLVPRYPRRIISPLIHSMGEAHSFRNAEELMLPLVPHFRHFDKTEANKFVDASIENNQIWDAYLCATDYIPRFINANKSRLNKSKLKILKYQIEKRKAHPSRIHSH